MELKKITPIKAGAEPATLYSQETEQALLALALKDAGKIIDLSKSEYFFVADNSRIWAAIESLHQAGQSIDPVTVSNLVTRESGKDLFDYIAELYDMDMPEDHADTYALIIKEHAYSRYAVQISDKLKRVASSPASATEKRSGFHSLMEDLETFAPPDHKTTSLMEALKIKADLMERTSVGEITPIMTGIDELDDITNGMQPGELIIVAGRPGMGKTTLALNICEYNATQHGNGSFVFSLEMSSPELGGRMASSLAKVDGRKMRNGNLTEREWMAYAEAIEKASRMDITIDDRGGLSIQAMFTALRRARREGNQFKLVVVDYIQIVTTESRNDNKYGDVTEISGMLKRMAKEFNVPVIALSQLSRDVEKRADKRPVTSDLRESGAIEQDADMIIFAYRDEVYHKDTPEPGVAELIIPKHRSGEPGVAKASFVGKYTRFGNREDSTYTSDWVHAQ